MNKWQGVGRLTKDVEFRQTEGGTSIARFTVACDRRFSKDNEHTADFISCVAFGKTAEFVNKYFVKGQRIGLSGHIQTGNYTDRDGNKRYTTDIMVEEVEFVESKGSGSGQQQTAPPPMAPQAPTMPPQMGAPVAPQNAPQQPYQAQPTNYAPQPQQAVQTPNTASQAYPQQAQYQQPYAQQQYQQAPPQQDPYAPGGFMYVPEGSGDETPFT